MLFTHIDHGDDLVIAGRNRQEKQKRGENVFMVLHSKWCQFSRKKNPAYEFKKYLENSYQF